MVFGADAGLVVLQMLQAENHVSDRLFLSDRGGLRGISAGGEFRKGDVLAHIPDRLLLTREEGDWVRLQESDLLPILEGGWASTPGPRLGEQIKISSQWLGFAALAAGLLRLSADGVTEGVLPAYKASLPSCPENSLFGADAVPVQAFGTVLSSVDMLRMHGLILSALELLLPERPVRNRQWAACMVLTRVFDHDSADYALVPFVDLINHGPMSVQNIQLRTDTISRDWQVVATRDILAGEELVYPYHVMLSQGLSSYLAQHGFAPGDVHPCTMTWGLIKDRRKISEDAWVSSGCKRYEAGGAMGVFDAHLWDVRMRRTIREAFRCMRIWLYSDQEVLAASVSGHLDAEGPLASRGQPPWLAKDFRVLSGFIATCSALLEPAFRHWRAQFDSLPAMGTGLKAILDVTDRETAAIEHYCRHLRFWGQALEVVMRAWRFES